MPPYHEQFAKGSFVQVLDRESLEQFQKTWKYHHPLVDAQLAHANAIAMVVNVGFYHGGDVLYWLEAIPGVWHEQCLKGPSFLEGKSATRG